MSPQAPTRQAPNLHPRFASASLMRMATASRLSRQLAEILDTLRRIGVQSALVGGLALSPHKVVRATQDIDLLVDQAVADSLHDEVTQLGYTCLHRSNEVANYQRKDERLDFLFAHRPIAKRLLSQAKEVGSSFGAVRVVSGEGLIGLKLQGVVNDPRRTQDLEDIKALLRANRDTLNMTEVREYFKLFERESLLDELIKQIA
jgi:hypothetical protein